ncbi:MAG: hypothetical protein ACE367_07890 [Acidimicrobiales bacterium]
MSRLVAHGIGIRLPRGWDGEIFLRDLDGDPTDDITDNKPVLHAANFALPPDRGDFGSAAVEAMGRPGVFLAVLEYENASADSALFAHRFPKRMLVREFGPDNLQRPLPGQSGAQRFVRAGGRAFCIYAVLGSHGLRRRLVPELNRVLETIDLAPVGR